MLWSELVSAVSLAGGILVPSEKILQWLAGNARGAQSFAHEEADLVLAI